MATLSATTLSFEHVSEDERKKSEEGFGISNGSSPFYQGAKLKVTGHDYSHPVINGKKSPNKSPVFVTSIGDMFLSMSTKGHVSFDGNVLYPNGSFNQFVVKTIRENKGKTDADIWKALEDGSKDKEIQITRKGYIGLSSDKRALPSELIIADFTDNVISDDDNVIIR